MDTTRYRSRRPGPEEKIEDAVRFSIPHLFNTDPATSWTASSMPVGAGMPDLVIVTFEPHVLALSKLDLGDEQLLAYLRGVRAARASTIAARTGRPLRAVVRVLDGLIEARAVEPVGRAFAMSDDWKRVLPEVVTVEAKVEKWQAAAGQALRNSIFAHRSYVALPAGLAERVRDEAVFVRDGIGVLAVDGHKVREVRSPRCRQPRVWSYYYRIALQVAQQFLQKGGKDAVHGPDQRRAG